MSVNLGICGPGCGAGDFFRGFEVLRSARKGFGRKSAVDSGLAGYRASIHSDNLQEWKFFSPSPRQSRFRDVVVRLQDLSCCSALGGRRMSQFSGFVSVARSPANSVWPLLNHRSEEWPGIVSSSHQNGPVDDTEPPPLFMGNQLKRFSHFRDGIVHWCRYPEVKKDVRNYGQEVLVRAEESLSPETQMGQDPTFVTVEAESESSGLTVICFDIETTGFSRSCDRIIEFAARDLAGGVCSTIETLVNPEREVRNEQVHKISSRMVNNSGVPMWKDVALALVDFVESRRVGQGLVILVAHNGKRFDVPFIMHEFRACGLSIPSYWRFADSMALAKLAKLPIKGFTLAQLFAYYNLPSVGTAHRAMADVNMLAQVLQKLMIDLEMGTSELLQQSFSADDVVLKVKDSSLSKKAIVKEKLDSRPIVDGVNGSGSGPAPWDLVSVDSGGRRLRNEVEFDRTLNVKFGEAWKPSSQHMSRAGATPLMRNPPRVVRTPAIRPKNVDVKRDIKT